jgi:hypothetical protein
MLRLSPTYEERLFDKREDWSSPLYAMTPRLAPSLARQSDHLVFMDDELNGGKWLQRPTKRCACGAILFRAGSDVGTRGPPTKTSVLSLFCTINGGLN